MTAGQIILYGLIAVIVIFYIRRFLMLRSVTHYMPDEVKSKIKNRSSVLLDVRTPAERNGNSIKNSIHIPLNELRTRLNELNKFKEKEIICFCRSGNRSVTAASILNKNGYDSASMKGGIINW